MRVVVGVDEVGRGPLAGPVVAAATAFRDGYSCSDIQDSKKLSQKKRELLVERIHADSIDWTIVSVPSVVIDRINIREAAKLAMSLAVRSLEGSTSEAETLSAGMVLVDGNMSIDIESPQQTVIGGDRKHVEISAASILAKVWRDRYMERLGARYSAYGFEQHAGYPTKTHKAAIERFGPCPEHRRSFKGVREYCVPHDALSSEEEPLIFRKDISHFT
jgi:ribonuclease HII